MPNMSRIVVSYWTNTEPPWDRDVPWIVRFAVRWGITMVGFLAAAWIVSGVEIDGWESLLPAAAIFVVLRALLRPLLIFLTCPLQLLTLGYSYSSSTPWCWPSRTGSATDSVSNSTSMASSLPSWAPW